MQAGGLACSRLQDRAGVQNNHGGAVHSGAAAADLQLEHSGAAAADL